MVGGWIVRKWREYWERADREMVEEFARKFPGRCMICSLWRFGVSHGYENKPLQPHDCIERPSQPAEPHTPPVPEALQDNRYEKCLLRFAGEGEGATTARGRISSNLGFLTTS